MDVTATPKHNNGAIFVQTVADYPLVSHLPECRKTSGVAGCSSRTKLVERQSAKYTEKYADYINLGVINGVKLMKSTKSSAKGCAVRYEQMIRATAMTLLTISKPTTPT